MECRSSIFVFSLALILDKYWSLQVFLAVLDMFLPLDEKGTHGDLRFGNEMRGLYTSWVGGSLIQ